MKSEKIQILRTLSSEMKFANPYWEYCFDMYELPNGKPAEYHYVNSRGSTIIIPKKENSFVLIRQYRYLNNKVSIEFPGGGIKQGLTPLQNAVEELKEEAGYTAENWSLIGEYNPFNGVTNEICSVFLAETLFFSGNSPEETEQFEIIELDYNEIINKIRTGEIWDGMTLAAWALLICNQKKV